MTYEKLTINIHPNKVSAVIILVSLVTIAEGVCKTSSSSGYRGIMAQCYCECNRAYQSGFQATTCTWFPYGQFSSGGCTYCDGAGRRRKRKSTSGPFAVQKCSCTGCDSLSGIYLGTLEDCQAYCKSQASLYLNNEVTYSYLPNGQFSRGSRKCYGYKDPCLMC